MVIFSRGPAAPLFITPDFSHVQRPVLEAHHTTSPVLYALLAVSAVLLFAAVVAVAWWCGSGGPAPKLSAGATPTGHPPRSVA